MFRKNKCKRKRKITETLTVNGYDVVITSNASIDKKGVKQSIAEYAVSVADFEEQFDSIAALINLDFFKGLAKITIQKADEKVVVKIKHNSGGKKNNVLANKEIKCKKDKRRNKGH